MSGTNSIWPHIEAHRDRVVAASDRVWAWAETAWEEFRSSAEHAACLEDAGFRVDRDPAGFTTAVVAEAGDGGPVIAFLGEYDALPGLSQLPGVARQETMPGMTNGHGCGHNLLGGAALLAALAVADWLARTGTPGRVRYYGCPAEEGGAGKVFMVRAGLFGGLDAALTWHPSSTTRVDPGQSLANMRIEFRFAGRAAHAAMSPHLGRSAVDAAELMHVGLNYLREHMPSDARLHYAWLDAGGPAPNVVQAQARTLLAIRARELSDLDALHERVCDIARGAALMTGTEVTFRTVAAYSNLLPNPPLRAAVHRALSRLGPVPFDDQDRRTALAFQATMAPANIRTDWNQIGRDPPPDCPLFDQIVPLDAPVGPRMSSTDVADVSWVVPTVEARVATQAMGTQPHSWQMTAQGQLPAAQKGMVHAAAALAETAVDLLRDPDLLAQVRADHAARIAASPYRCLIPPEVQPPVRPRPAGDGGDHRSDGAR